MEKILHRGKLTWVVREKSILVYDKIQATLYVPYISPNDHLFLQMRTFLLNSKPTEYGDWVEAILLAQKCKVKGMGARYPKIDINGNV